MRRDGNNIYVKPLELEDAETMLRLELRNRHFFQLYTSLREERFFTLAGQQERIQGYIEKQAQDQHYGFGIYLLQTGELIGNVNLSEVARGPLQCAWIGYCLDQEQNGKGYMTEAVRLVVSIAFDQLKLHRIEAGVMPHNLGSIKVLEKAGFHKEGIAKQNVKINGKWQDHQILAIVNEEESEKKERKVIRKNPDSVATPIGPYTHLAIVSRKAEHLVLSGQVGIDTEGDLPSDVKAQFRNALNNVLRILNSEDVFAESIVKINIWLTESIDRDSFYEIWEELHGGTPPAMTLVYVSALATPALKVEVEVWAAR
ncbi:GNAT family N-acetyltransferase [Desmospora activa]|uniref:Ribosomal-protein-alanine N-acetyltransferase n=1 Tax=Desmospora activa DSM 45169 TaxID=1121389 RepID=A0A2T4ZD15_9BACL|nr:GNAT family N-acetyltransferase [Desmospora activa]PTM59770.1 ribosomal-protein-alanine N-acetyltransferase [Desmospora activa DSM 45169]